MVVDIHIEDHNMDKDMNKYDRLMDVEYIGHHLYILLHYPNNWVLQKKNEFIYNSE